MYKYKLVFSNVIRDILITIIGSAIMAIGISLFLLPNKLSTGGVSGISTVLYYLFNMPMGLSILIINIPLFLFGMFKIGKYFFAKSILGTVSLSLFIEWFENFDAITDDRLLACIYGGILVGIGTAMLLKINSSTGGTEIVSYIAKGYNPNLKSSNIIMVVDILIISINMFFLGEIEIGLYSAIAIYILGKIVDILFEGIYFTKLLLIISDRNQEISDLISTNVNRGLTGLYGRGMYTNSEKLILMCAAGRNDIAKIKSSVRSIDPNAFIIITNSREVLGLGFKK